MEWFEWLAADWGGTFEGAGTQVPGVQGEGGRGFYGWWTLAGVKGTVAVLPLPSRGSALLSPQFFPSQKEICCSPNGQGFRDSLSC